MKTVIIVANPISGRGKSLKVAQQFKERASIAGFESVVIGVLGKEEMLKSLRVAVENDRQSIGGVISVGGDGLLHALLPVLREFDLPFTVIPTGTGNDFAREIGAMRRTLDETIKNILEAPVAIDSVIIKGNGGEARACQVLSLGFDALVNERANGFRRIRGKMKYVIATIRELALFKPMRFEINIDGVDYSQQAMLIAVANGPSYGGGMKICPGARFDDGLLDVLILSKVSIIELIKVFPKVYSGSHISHPAIQVIKGREIRVNAPAKAYADGEYISELPITIHVEPGSLKVWR